MTTSKLDEIAARAELAQGAWEDFQLGIATTRFALEEANNSAEDVKPMLDALKAVEAVHVREDSESFYNDFYGNSRSKLVYYCGTCMDDEEEPYSWPCPTIAAIKDALGS